MIINKEFPKEKYRHIWKDLKEKGTKTYDFRVRNNNKIEYLC